MAELFVVRHAQASFGADDYDKLSALGKQQSQWLGAYFAERQVDFHCLWRGSMVRHAETAGEILSQLPLTPEENVSPALNEFDFQWLSQAYLRQFPDDKVLANAPRSAYYRLLRKAMLAWSEDQLEPDELVETWADFRQRVAGCLQLVMQEQSDKPVLMVSSGGVIAMLMSLVLGLEARQVIELNLQIANCSVSHFHFNRQSIRLSSFNTLSHLDTAQRRGFITYS